MQANFSVSERGSAVGLGLAGYATARASASQIAELRKNPGLPGDRALPSGFLKHSDEQTILALAIMSQAMISLNKPADFYRHWGVVAAPNLFGRSGIYQGLCAYRKDGAWGITPHLIPHYSLHAISGTISQVLGIHGPNFGISGGPKAVGEAFLSAATLLSENNLPGLWVVLSGHNPECLPNENNQKNFNTANCLIAALALEPPNVVNSSTYLHISASDNVPQDLPDFSLPDFLAAMDSKTPSGRWALPGDGWIEMNNEKPFVFDYQEIGRTFSWRIISHER